MREKRHLIHVLAAGIFALGIAACGDDGDDENKGTDTSPGTDGADGTVPGGFTGGMFEVKTVGVDDQCLDKALNEVFLPGGKERQLPDNEVPAEKDLPKAITVKLAQAGSAFADMPVTVESAGKGAMKFANGAQAGLDLDKAQWPECKVDMDITADITVVDDDNLTIAAALTMKNPVGKDCPVFDKDPCKVLLDIKGARKK